MVKCTAAIVFLAVDCIDWSTSCPKEIFTLYPLIISSVTVQVQKTGRREIHEETRIQGCRKKQHELTMMQMPLRSTQNTAVKVVL